MPLAFRKYGRRKQKQEREGKGRRADAGFSTHRFTSTVAVATSVFPSGLFLVEVRLRFHFNVISIPPAIKILLFLSVVTGAPYRV